MKNFLTMLVVNIDFKANSQQEADDRVRELNNDQRLKAEIEEYLNRKLGYFKVTASRVVFDENAEQF